MESYEVNVHERMVSGKGEIKKLINEGFIPGILYNQGEGIPVSLELDTIRRLLNRERELVTLDIHYNGVHMKALIKEVQRDPLTQEIKHIDLMPVDEKGLH